VTAGNTDIPADDGTPFLLTTTTASPSISLEQQLMDIPSGTTLRCSMDVLVPTQSTTDQVFSVNFQINGQSCASIGGIWTSDWLTISNFPVATFSDDPVDIEIQVSWNNANHYQLDLGLDNLFVWIDTGENADWPLCPPSPEVAADP
jgi:hypothetical protein